MKFFNQLFICCLLCSSSFISQAQTNQDIGVRFSSLENFGFIYKKELKKDYYFRFNAASFAVSFAENQFNTLFSSSIGLGGGFEKRHFINDKFAFINGLNFNFFTAFRIDNLRANHILIAPSLGYMLGIHYAITPDIYFNAEIAPALRSNISIGGNNRNFNLGLIADSGSLTLGIVYNFKK